MKNVRRSFLVGSVFLMVLCGFLVYSDVAFPASDQLVKIQPVGHDKLVGIFIDPTVTYIERNGIVIWLNGVAKDDVQVIFEEGRTCQDVTANPWGFSIKVIEKQQCYVTDFLKFGETSSLQFPQAGTFRYKVVTLGGEVKAEGKIVVRF